MSAPTSQRRRRIVIGISGASGVVYGIRLLQILRDCGVETHLVMSRSAQADAWHANSDVGAAISSGSFRVDGMIVAPCSVKTLSEIATGCTGTLLARAADVVLKERRRLVLMVRETPLHIGHIRSMAAVTEAGGIICPPVPAFYTRPRSLEDMVDHMLGRVLDLFDIEFEGTRRWKAEGAAEA
jgi:4-hydroxy-3-polyprenylbenzoate decarboxylase